MRAYLGLFVWMLCLWAGSVQAGETFRFRVYLKDKGESGYTLDKPREFLSSEAIARRTRQGIALSPTDLPIAQAYLDTLSAHGGRPILTVTAGGKPREIGSQGKTNPIFLWLCGETNPDAKRYQVA